MNEDRRYVPNEEELEAVRRLREARRLMGMIATGLVLAFTILLAIQHSRGPRERGSEAEKNRGPAVSGKNRPSSSSPGKP